MAITGSGTIEDPFVVETFSELVDKIRFSSSYVKLKQDIDVSAEFPNGYNTQITISGALNGNNYSIKNLYTFKTNLASMFNFSSNSSSSITNCNFTNLNIASPLFSYASSSLPNRNVITSTNFSGVCSNGVAGQSTYITPPPCFSCSFNIDGIKSTFGNVRYNLALENCYIKFKSDATHFFNFNGFVSSFQGHPKNSYFELDMPNFEKLMEYNSTLTTQDIDSSFSNCIFDIMTNKSFSLENNNPINCIINTTHAPKAEIKSGWSGVSEEDWLNKEKLRAAGLAIG